MSGVPLVLGAAAALAALSRRGSRNLPEPSKWMVGRSFDFQKALKGLEEFQESLEYEHGGFYSRGQSRHSDPRKGYAYVFNVKMYQAPSFPPDYDEIFEKHGVEEREAYDVVWEKISDDREHLHEMLKEDYDWIEKIEVAGRQGGYMVVVADEDFEDVLEDLDNMEPEREYTISGPRYSPEQMNEVRQIYSTMHKRMKDLDAIEARVKKYLEGVASYVASDEFWEDYKNRW